MAEVDPNAGPSSGAAPPPPAAMAPVEVRRRGELVTDRGKTSIADSVVAKIAGLSTREIPGVAEMGQGSARFRGAIREKLPGGSGAPSPTQGVSVEVGERQAAIDLDVVAEYGASIPQVAEAIRSNVSQRVEGMTGLEVTEVNVSVDDLRLGEAEPQRVE